jgi:hypothetical protein
MKILLLGEYSGLHHNLAEGLRKIGHDVTVASEGCGWKNYPRDIDFNYQGRFRRIKSFLFILSKLHRFIGYDIVQFINPNFLETLPNKNKIFFSFLNLFNKNIFLGAFGDDYFYVKYGMEGGFPRSIFNEKHLLHDEFISYNVLRCLQNDYKKLNEKMAQCAKGIIACCAEYELAYRQKHSDKLTFIPMPIQTDTIPFCNTITNNSSKVSFFLGHYKYRQVLKGTDVIEKALLQLKKKYPNQVTLNIVDSIPFDEYQNLLNDSHVLCDQLYAYGYGLNGVLAMSKGLILAGCGSSELYHIMGEKENKPIVQLPMNKDELFKKLESLILNKDTLVEQAIKTREFAVKHHDYIKVAKKYLDFWSSKIS